jgi:hypothetical protein
MIALLKSRWILLTVVVPVGVWMLDRLGAGLEDRTGETTMTRLLRWPRAVRTAS